MTKPESVETSDDLQLFSIPQFADRAGGVSRWTIIKWIKDGRVRSVKLGSRRLIPVSELRRVCKEGLAA